MSSDVLDRIKVRGPIPVHIAIIMDGNGRWARARGLPRYRGHAAGMAAVREVIEGAVEAGVEILTLYAFSQENWNRPRPEISALMQLFQRYLVKEREELRERGVEVRVLGDLDRLPAACRTAVGAMEAATRGGRALRLNLMVSYGGRAELVRAMRSLALQVARGERGIDSLDEAAVSAELYTAGLPDPDLLIRTSGEQRISNFMLWQLAYTELYLSPVLWPDFQREHLFAAIEDFQKRERRFGRVTAV
jgi:undecaprenyl diphosphate synthase